MAETIEKKTFAVNMQLVYIFAAGLVYMVYNGTTKLNDFESRVKSLEAAPAKVQQLEDEQRKSEADIRELQSTMNGIKANVETMAIDVKALNSQIQSLVSTLKK